MRFSESELLSAACPVCGANRGLSDARCLDCGYAELDGFATEFVSRARELESAGWVQEPLLILERLSESGLTTRDSDNMRVALVEKQDRMVCSFMNPLRDKKLREASRNKDAVLAVLPDLEVDGKTIQGWAEWLTRQLEVEIPRRLQAGRAHETTDRERAFLDFTAVLKICADCDQARYGLQRCPPRPPVAAKINRIDSKTLEIYWEKSPSLGDLKYSVRRMLSSTEITTEAGEAVPVSGELRVSDCVDELVGCSVRYAVFARREGVFSSAAAVAGPVLITAEVKHLRLGPGDGRIDARWLAPPRVRSIRVTRKAGEPPRHAGDGDLVESQIDGFIDLKVRNGTRYHYLVSVVFMDEEGLESATEGVRADGLPDRIPTLVEHLTARPGESCLCFEWIRPTVGRVAIMGRTSPFANGPGKLLWESEIHDIGQVIVDPTDENSAAVESPEDGVYFFAAVSIQGERARLGSVIKFVHLRSVTDALLEPARNGLRVRWHWPAGGELATVAWRTDHSPRSPDESGTQSLEITAGQYHRQGGVVVPTKSGQRCELAIFSSRRIGGAIHHASGIADSARVSWSGMPPARVSYSLRTVHNWLHRVTGFELKICSDRDLELPETVFCAKRRFVPLSSDDGVKVARLHGVSLQAKVPHTVQLNARWLTKDYMVKGFFVQEDSYEMAQLFKE